MAFPLVKSTGIGVNTSDSTSHPIVLPRHSAGDLIVVIFGVDGNPTITVDTDYSGNSWTGISATAHNGTTLSSIVVDKIASSSSELLQFNTSSPEQSCHSVYVITGTNNNAAIYAIVSVSSSTGTSTNFDPPTNNGYNGSQDYLWLAVGIADGTTVASSAPTDFISLSTSAGTSTGVSTSGCYRKYTGLYLDPGPFTSASSAWIAYNINIEPYSGVQFMFPFRQVDLVLGSLFNGLVSYWKLDETLANSAIDSMGYQNLNVQGATVNQSGIVGTSYQFTPDQYIGKVDNFKFTTSFSVSLWIKTNTTSNYESPIGNFHWTGDGWDLVRMQTTGYLEWSLRSNGNDSAIVEYNTNVADNNWHHVVCIYDGTYARMYVDNTECTPVAFSYTITYNANNRFCIGTREDGDNHWTGYIDEVGIWDRALNANEVSYLYNSGSGRSYPFS